MKVLLMLFGFILAENSRADVTGCSTGFTLVPGSPSTGFASFCVSVSEYTASGQDFAALGCANGAGYLCSTMELQRACYAGIVGVVADRWLYTSDAGFATAQRSQVKLWGGGSACYNKQDSFGGTTLRPYRCCTR